MGKATNEKNVNKLNDGIMGNVGLVELRKTGILLRKWLVFYHC
jgi:hypothetical protein